MFSSAEKNNRFYRNQSNLALKYSKISSNALSSRDFRSSSYHYLSYQIPFLNYYTRTVLIDFSIKRTKTLPMYNIIIHMLAGCLAAKQNIGRYCITDVHSLYIFVVWVLVSYRSETLFKNLY